MTDLTSSYLYAVVWQRLKRNRLALAGGCVVLLLFVVSLLAPLIVPSDPNAIDAWHVLSPPSWQHWFGTDELGRDVLSRMIYGSRISLKVGFVAVGIAVSIAGAVGVEQYESEALVRMGPGLGKPVDDVVFVYTETRFVNNHSYFGQQGVIEVLRLDDESLITTLRPERQTFVANGMQMSAAGIDHGFLRDYYVSMGNKLTDTEWLVRLSIKPLAGWIWGGGAVMILAALIILFTRRRETETAAQELEAPSK